MTGDFSSLFGNEATKSRIADAIRSRTLPHAHLITGKAGSGKRTLAREIAMALNCESKLGILPCHRCNTCRRISEGNYPDVYTLKREGSRSSIGVEDVRRFKSSMMLSPVESDYKIYVIEDADRLTVQAQNALLTFLEEPPRNTYIFLLASSADTILTTIKSRAQSTAMSRFEKDELKEHLCRLNERARNMRRFDEETLDSIVMNADGVIGRAISIIEEGGEGEIAASARATEDIVSAICKSAPYSELYTALSNLPTDRKKLISALESLILAIRDIILCRFDAEATPVFYSSREKAIELSRSTSSKKLLRVYDVLTLAIQDAASNVGIQALITGIATKIKLL